MFKKEFVINWPSLVLLLLSSYFSFSCTFHSSLTLWREEIPVRPQICEGQVSFSFTTAEEKMKGRGTVLFEFHTQKPKLSLTILNPFNTIEAKVEIAPQKKIWVNAEGAHDLKEYPFFDRWFHQDWVEETAFLFGIPHHRAKGKIWVDAQNNLREFRAPPRLLQCHRNRKCMVKDENFEGQVNFTSVKCKELL